MRDHVFVPPRSPSVRVRVLGAGPGLLLLHGFASGIDGWPADELARLARIRTVVTFDLPGHGGSEPAGRGEATPDRLVDLVDAVWREFLGNEPVDLLGYSMGARLAMTATAAGLRPSRLLLESPNPGLDTPADREVRRKWDAAWARRFEDAPGDALEDWLAQPLFATRDRLSSDESEHQRGVRAEADGPSLAVFLREFGTGTMKPLWTDLPHMAVPMHVIVGEHDTRYVDIAERIRSACPTVQTTIARGVGHAPHLEAPGRWGDWVENSLERAR